MKCFYAFSFSHLLNYFGIISILSFTESFKFRSRIPSCSAHHRIMRHFLAGCFKRKRSLTPAYGAPASSSSPYPSSPPSIQATQALEYQRKPATQDNQTNSSTIPYEETSKTTASASHVVAQPPSPDSEEITTATFSVSNAQSPRTAKITSASALSFADSSYNRRRDQQYGSSPLIDDHSRFPDASNSCRDSGIPRTNSKVMWGGSSGPGQYGDYKPISVLDNRNYTRSTGNLDDFDRGSAYFDRGGSRSRPITPSSGYATVDRITGRSGGARTPSSAFYSREKDQYMGCYSAMGSLRSTKGREDGRYGGGFGRDRPAFSSKSTTASALASGRSSLSM